MVRSRFVFKDSCLAFLFAVLAFFVVSMAFSIFIAQLAKYLGKSTQEMLELPWVSILSSVLSELTFVLTFLIYTKTCKKSPISDSTLSKKTTWQVSLIVALFSIVVLLCSMNFTGMFNALFALFAKPNSSSINLPLDTFPQFLLGVVVLALLPAVCEELLFRGLILSGFLKKFKPVLAVVLNAILFALIHLSIYSTIHQLILGLVLGMIFVMTGSVFYTMLFHFVNNFFVVLFSCLFKDNFPLQITTWGAWQVAVTIAVFFVGVGLTIVFCYILKKARHQYKLQEQNDGNDFELKEEENNQSFSNNDKTNALLLVVGAAVCLIIWITNSLGG